MHTDVHYTTSFNICDMNTCLEWLESPWQPQQSAWGPCHTPQDKRGSGLADFATEILAERCMAYQAIGTLSCLHA